VTELVPSLVGAGLVVGLAVPVATLVTKGLLVARFRRDPHPRRHGSLGTFLLLLAPSLGAIAWFTSAGFHLSEPGADTGCAIDHDGAAACVDAILFAGLLSTLIVTAFTRGWWRHASRRDRTVALPADAPASRRVTRICASHPRLRALSRRGDRVRVVATAAHPICTRGLLRPVIEVSVSFLARVGDEALLAALLHEAEHHDGRDPLRRLVAAASLTLNPCGALLRPELRRWSAAREAVCDERAVRHGADPLALADALVVAARTAPPRGTLAVGLGGPSAGLLQLRIQLLVGFARRHPGRPSAPALWIGLAATAAVIALPHLLGAWPLDLAHGALERALIGFGLL